MDDVRGEFIVFDGGDVRMCGVITEVDPETGKASHIERVEIQGPSSDQAYDADDRAHPAGE